MISKLPEIYSLFKQFPVISTDTRNIIPASIFFALKGEHFDGNKFAESALKNGAAYAIVDDKSLAQNSKIIVVENTLATLQGLAQKHREQLRIPVIAITGTNGKTTTKELCRCVLSQKYKSFATAGNFNNHIGVPLSILAIDDSYEMAIIEMGANHPGEIAELCKIANPDFGLITNIGKAHLEGFGGFEGILKTKTELYNHIKLRQGKLFVNADNPLLMEKSQGIDRILYGQSKDADIYGQINERFPFLSIELSLNNENTILDSQLIGTYNFENMMAASCIGHFFGIDAANIAQGLSGYKPTNNRSQWLETKKNKIILDAYNANPSSMKLAIENFAELPYPNKAVILGDMLELGSASATEHQEIINLVLNQDFEKIILVGEAFKKLADHPGLVVFNNATEAQSTLQNQQLSDYTILIKGSRGIGLEKLLEEL